MERVRFDGERPVTWVAKTDPLWRDLSARWMREKPPTDHGPNRPKAMYSKHVDHKHGPGWFFPTSWVVAIEARDRADGIRRPQSGEDTWRPPTEESKARVDAMVAALRAVLAAADSDDKKKAEAAYRAAIDAGNYKFGQPDLPGNHETFWQMCKRLGIDPDTVPDRSLGPWQKLQGQTEEDKP